MQLELPIEIHEENNWFKRMCSVLEVDYIAGWPDIFGKKMNEWLYINGHNKIKTLSLFSGGGGLDIGFSDCGFDIVEMIEIEKNYCKTLTENIGKSHYNNVNAKVTCLDIKEYLFDHNQEIDFIIGGPPCQTFSAAGRRAFGVSGTDDPRGTLFIEYVRLLTTIKPKGFLFENVYGIVGAQGGKPWSEIQEEFQKAGYTIFLKSLIQQITGFHNTENVYL